MTPDFKGVARSVGAVVIGLGFAIGLCAVVGFLFYSASPIKAHGVMGSAGALGVAAVLTMSMGAALFWFGRGGAAAVVTRRGAVLSVALIWLAAAVFGAIPFVLGEGLSPADAFFEAMSGLTTTGATVVQDIEGELSWSVLLWRSLIQWLGGMGIVVLFVAIFPNVGAGAKHMFRGEVPGTSAEDLKPRIAETSFSLWKLYVAFTVAEMLVLRVLGVSWFESICHAFTTMSTGGFSTRNASIAGFDSPAVEMAIACFMLIASVNYALYYGALRGRSLRVILRSVEFRVFVVVVLVSTALLAIGIRGNHDHDLLESSRYAFFMVATTISSTGYGTDAYMQYPPAALSIVLMLMLIGACSGSTAGGIKVERVVLTFKRAVSQIKLSYRPNVVHVIRMGRSVVDNAILADVAAFLAIYFGCLALGVAVISLAEGVGVPTAFGAMLTCLSNMGPAPFHIGADNFAAYSSFTKVFCALAMLLGRLEFFTLLALLVPSFWKR